MLSLIINFPCSPNKACLIGGFFFKLPFAKQTHFSRTPNTVQPWVPKMHAFNGKGGESDVINVNGYY